MSVAEKDPRERTEDARLSAKSAARDLLRLVRALKAGGVDLSTLGEDERDALDQCNQDLAEALAAVEEDVAALRGVGAAAFLRQVESSVAETKALLVATRQQILEGLERHRRQDVLQAMLRVEVTDDDLTVESISPVGEAEIAAARRRAEERLVKKRRSEARRRRAEAQAIDVDARLVDHLTALPAPWLRAVAAFGACEPLMRDARTLALRLSAPETLAALVADLRPRDRAALASLLDAEGVVLARVLEKRFGDVSEDGFEWDVDPPTSTLGRLRARGLCFVGRTVLGGNPKSRPRCFVVPADLRAPLKRALATTLTVVAMDPLVPAEVVEVIMDGEAADEAEAESIRFDRAQPELAGFAAAATEALDAPDARGALVYFVERIWASYEAAHEGKVPRLRRSDVETARRDSDRELASLAEMHERLLQRRVGTLMQTQPHLYAYLAGALEELSVSEGDRAIVFHACDTAIRAFDASLRP